jgi:HEPN domain-containing protein
MSNRLYLLGGSVANAVMEGPSMTNVRLAEAFLQRAASRLKALDSLRHEADFSDVVREARDIVEMCFRGMLRLAGIEVPRWLDVGDVLTQNVGRLPTEISSHRTRILEIYRDLRRRERQVTPADEIPPPAEKLMMADADRAISEAEWILGLAQNTLDVAARRKPTPSVA